MPRSGRPKGSGTVPAEHRFWAKVNRGGPVPDYAPHLGPCWIWTGAKTGNGRPNFKVRSYVTIYAYRYAYELIVGPIPLGTELDHLCRVPACVNPAHLEAVAHVVNERRKPDPTHCPAGHEYNTRNASITKLGVWHCRICDRDRKRAAKASHRGSPAT